ncbi:Lymphocyte antigen 75 [Merluccius polli]|uniref:Lymphocyte antigen 75 n=1 Tax=Merluccius polli TaxID=89951 RepID=A0AA47MY44_MERPO|nr:Lymphocyte antigen 75 [Merluccius polli]
MERLFIVILLFTGIWGYPNYHYISKKISWQEAQSYCRERNSDLATISNMEDNNRALKSVEDKKKQNMSKPNVWIGLNKNNAQEAWRWSEDSSKASFCNWKENEPSGMKNDQQNCVEMRPDGCWNDVQCHHKSPFICNDFFPMILISENKTWEEAVDYCRENHHDLLSAHNDSMRENIQKIAKRATTDFVWIGLHYTCVMDFWFWIDNEEFNENNWDQETHKGDFCGTSGAMKKSSTKFFSRPNTERLNFICSLCETNET